MRKPWGLSQEECIDDPKAVLFTALNVRGLQMHNRQNRLTLYRIRVHLLNGVPVL